jgi:hypothetical protein
MLIIERFSSIPKNLSAIVAEDGLGAVSRKFELVKGIEEKGVGLLLNYSELGLGLELNWNEEAQVVVQSIEATGEGNVEGNGEAEE